MAEDFTMPKLGLTMTDGTIREWLVADGASVQQGDPVLVIETDKVETEVEARSSGVLSISGVVGENYECGAVIGLLLGSDESAPAAASPVAAPASAEAPVAAAVAADPAPVAAAVVTPAPVAAPVVTAAVGADVAARGEGGRILASPMARAAAKDRGIALEHIVGTGPSGRIIADDVSQFVTPQVPATTATGLPTGNGAAPSDVAVRGEGGRILASPMARAAAKDRGIALDAIRGTGPDGRIVAEDVDAYVAPAPAAPGAPAAATSASPAPASPAVAPVAVPATSGGRMLAELLGVDLRLISVPAGSRITREDVAAYVRSQLSSGASAPETAAQDVAATVALLQEPTTMVPLRGMRGVIAERMHASLHEMAQLTLSVDVDMSAVSAARSELKAEHDTVPGYTAWVIAAASRALVEHPYVNSQVTPDGVAYLPEVHVGVAVALDDGLIVPVIRHASSQPVADLHLQVADLASRARESKLTLDELQGGTFSVTALGMYGVDVFTPVINPPNTAILGVGRLRTDTNWDDGVPKPTTVMTLSLTWDHRAFDGAPAAEFAQTIVRLLEDPAQLAE